MTHGISTVSIEQIRPSVFFCLKENACRLILRVSRERGRLIPGGAAEILGTAARCSFHRATPTQNERVQ